MLSPEELALRKTGIGASEIGAVVGLNPYAGPLDVYLRKLDLIEDDAGEAAEWGHLLEPLIADRYARETGETLERCSTLVHPSEPWILATPDRLSLSGRVVECKTASLRVAHRWGEPGTDEVPEEYLAQVTWQMLVTGHRVADIALLVGGQEFRIYTVPFDGELAAALVEQGRAFWHDHVLAQVPPPSGSEKAVREWLRQRYPRDLGDIRTAGPDEADALEALRQARIAFAEAEARKTAAEDQVKRLIGDDAGLSHPEIGRVTWKKNKDSERVDWKAVAKALQPSADLVAKHTTIRPGPRVLRCNLKED